MHAALHHLLFIDTGIACKFIVKNIQLTLLDILGLSLDILGLDNLVLDILGLDNLALDILGIAPLKFPMLEGRW